MHAAVVDRTDAVVIARVSCSSDRAAARLTALPRRALQVFRAAVDRDAQGRLAVTALSLRTSPVVQAKLLLFGIKAAPLTAITPAHFPVDLGAVGVDLAALPLPWHAAPCPAIAAG